MDFQFPTVIFDLDTVLEFFKTIVLSWYVDAAIVFELLTSNISFYLDYLNENYPSFAPVLALIEKFVDIIGIGDFSLVGFMMGSSLILLLGFAVAKVIVSYSN